MLTLDAFSEAHQSCESGESAGRAADSFQLFINFKSAMALGLKISAALLALTDDVIERIFDVGLWRIPGVMLARADEVIE